MCFMAIAATTTMRSQDDDQSKDQGHGDHHHRRGDHHDGGGGGGGDEDRHDQDVVMPGFRFHPTEEELIEFYLRRKVEGKRFNVELITFLDLYRYDPWELPALAAIGEKEWFFYVPRDRKYRNGDRPNRVTTSGYWKATGADRMIRTENLRSIGLKKTLVFYSGKAPKGIRTSWIMNEYRLPHHETERLQKAEISLCRVYKRAGVEDHPSLPRSLPTRASSSRATQLDKRAQNQASMQKFQPFVGNAQPEETEKISETSASSSTEVGTGLGLSHCNSFPGMASITSQIAPPLPPPPLPHDPLEETRVLLLQSRQNYPLSPNCNSWLATPNQQVDDLHRLVNFQQETSINHHFQTPTFTSNLQPQPLLPLNAATSPVAPPFWEWNPNGEGGKDYIIPFK